jgi:TetR/AcrR family transcriptional repressor of nem operon
MARTRTYDQTDLLRRSMELFWARGFAGVSIDDIVAATGVSRSSLYAAFPDKTALFTAVLEHYVGAVTRANLERLAAGENAAAAIRRFFLHLADQRPRARAPAHGCLLTNTAVELGAEPAAVARLVSGAFRRMEKALTQRLEEARRQGDVPAAIDTRRFARQLVALIQGLRVMSRLGMEPRLLRDAVRSALAPLRDRNVKSNRRRNHGQATTAHKGAAAFRQHRRRRRMGAR